MKFFTHAMFLDETQHPAVAAFMRGDTDSGISTNTADLTVAAVNDLRNLIAAGVVVPSAEGLNYLATIGAQITVGNVGSPTPTQPATGPTTPTAVGMHALLNSGLLLAGAGAWFGHALAGKHGPQGMLAGAAVGYWLSTPGGRAQLQKFGVG